MDWPPPGKGAELQLWEGALVTWATQTQSRKEKRSVIARRQRALTELPFHTLQPVKSLTPQNANANLLQNLVFLYSDSL